MQNYENKENVSTPLEIIENKILVIRGKKVILDSDLAALYGVKTLRLNEQVKRNIDKFPGDFMFELTHLEKQEVIAKCDNLYKLKFSPVLPKAFTEHGVLQAANVLNSKKANQVSIQVIRIFNKLRELAWSNQEIKTKLKDLEKSIDVKFANTDKSFKIIFETLNHVLYPPDKPKKFGFRPNSKKQ